MEAGRSGNKGEVVPLKRITQAAMSGFVMNPWFLLLVNIFSSLFDGGFTILVFEGSGQSWS